MFAFGLLISQVSVPPVPVLGAGVVLWFFSLWSYSQQRILVRLGIFLIPVVNLFGLLVSNLGFKDKDLCFYFYNLLCGIR